MSDSRRERQDVPARRWIRRGCAVVLLASLMAILCWPTVVGRALSVSVASDSAVSGEQKSDGPNDPSTTTIRGNSPELATNPRAAAVPFDPVAAYAANSLSEMTLEEKIRSLLVLHSPGTDIAGLQAFMGAYNPGGFILMGNNIPAEPGELAALTAALSRDPELPAIVAIDEEGGDVTRLPYDSFAGANTLRVEDPSLTLSAFRGRAELLKSVGVNVNFGIVADVTDNPQSFIFSRTLGDAPDAAASRVAAAVEGEKSIVASTLKHFPGHGSTTGDSHVSIPATGMTEQEWRSSDAVPFAAGIDGGTPLVMFGHLAYTSVDAAPASLSPAWHSILRDELGFSGLPITDDMTMLQRSGLAQYSDPVQNAISAVVAGNDLLLYVLAADPSIDGVDPNAIVAGLLAAVSSGQSSSSQIDASALHVLTLRRSYAADALTWHPPCSAPCRALVDAVDVNAR